jgi:ABC-2 type transport system ATP-binding protein
MPILEVKNLNLKFGKVQRLKDCSFSVEKGEIFGLLGQNGSGKSSIIKSTLGLFKPSDGEITFHCSRDEIGYVPQHFAFFPEYTAEENLRFFCRLEKNPKAVDALLSEFGLVEVKRTRAGHLSGGYKRLLNMAISMPKKVKLLILDEPTANMDVLIRKQIMEFIQKINDSGTSIIITTHYMDEAEQYCDRVALVADGKISAVGEVPQLVEKYGGTYSVEATSAQATELAASLKKAGFKPSVAGERVRTEIPNALGNSGTIRAMKIFSKFQISSLKVDEPSLSKAVERLYKHA